MEDLKDKAKQKIDDAADSAKQATEKAADKAKDLALQYNGAGGRLILEFHQ